jgi:GAF domain-containing protein
MADGDIFLAATKADVRRAYADHDALFALGIESILNVPVRAQWRRLGTLNLCGAEGSFGPAEVARAREVAEMLVGVM